MEISLRFMLELFGSAELLECVKSFQILLSLLVEDLSEDEANIEKNQS